MATYTIYHNPRCSKSRETLALLEQHNIAPQVILYLTTPLTVSDIQQRLDELNLSPRQLIRSKESDYKTLNLANPELTDSQLIAAMVAHPKLIERPIVIKHSDNKSTALLGRPPENVLALIS